MIPHKVVPAQQRYETGSYQEGDSDAEGVSFYFMGGEENKCGEERVLCDGSIEEIQLFVLQEPADFLADIPK